MNGLPHDLLGGVLCKSPKSRNATESRSTPFATTSASGSSPHVTRLPNGIRDFTEYDCGWVEFIRCMRESGVQIEALVEYVALFQEGEHTAAARLEILEEQRAKLVAKLEEMQATAKRLDAKIASYRPGGECSDGGDEWLRKE